MKRLSLLAVMGLAVASAHASIFNTTSVQGDINSSPAGSFSQTELGNSYTLNVNDFTLSGGDSGDISWAFTFNSSVPYKSVTYTINGTVSSTDFENTIQHFTGNNQAVVSVTGDEKVLDAGNNLVGQGTIPFPGYQYSFADGSPQDFHATIVIPISPATANGAVLKDQLFLALSDNAQLDITSIQQDFQPVPEPATMAILGIGALGMAARKKRKN